MATDEPTGPVNGLNPLINGACAKAATDNKNNSAASKYFFNVIVYDSIIAIKINKCIAERNWREKTRAGNRTLLSSEDLPVFIASQGIMAGAIF